MNFWNTAVLIVVGIWALAILADLLTGLYHDLRRGDCDV